MVLRDFENSLASLKGTTAKTWNPESFLEPGTAPVEVYFSDESRLRMNYWRMIRAGKAAGSSFDHQQKYVLRAPVNSFAVIAEALDGRTVL